MNMQTIADQAGVSRMTVSRVLRNHPRVLPRTREKVLRIAADLGYQPNPMVSVLMSHISTGRPAEIQPTLVYVIQNNVSIKTPPTDPSSTSYFIAAARRARELGFQMDYMQVGHKEMNERRFNEILHTRNVPGIIIAPMQNAGDKINLNWSQLCSVAIGYSMSEPNLHRVCLDYYTAMTGALNKLWAKGYRRFALYLRQSTDQRIRHMWTSAFLTFHWGKQLPMQERVRIPSSLPIDQEDFHQWFIANSPEVLISQIDDIVYPWFVEAREAAGVPDCRFIHVDEDCIHSRTNIDGTFSGSRNEIGTAAVDMLFAQIKRNERGLPSTPHTCLIEPQFNLYGNW